MRKGNKGGYIECLLCIEEIWDIHYVVYECVTRQALWWYFSIRHGYKFRTDTFCVSLTICLKYTIAVTNQLLFIFINLSFTVKTLTYLCTYMYSFSETRRDWEFRLTPLELNIVLLKGLRKICSCELWEFVKIKNRSWKLGRASRWGFSFCRL